MLDGVAAFLRQGDDLPELAVVAAGTVVSAAEAVIAEGGHEAVAEVYFGYLPQLVIKSACNQVSRRAAG